MPERLVNESAPTLVTVRQVHAEFEKLLKDRTEMGGRNFLGDKFLEPRNPFEPGRRKPRKWVVILGCLLLLGLLITYTFHMR